MTTTTKVVYRPRVHQIINSTSAAQTLGSFTPMIQNEIMNVHGYPNLHQVSHNVLSAQSSYKNLEAFSEQNKGALTSGTTYIMT